MLFILNPNLNLINFEAKQIKVIHQIYISSNVSQEDKGDFTCLVKQIKSRIHLFFKTD